MIDNILRAIGKEYRISGKEILFKYCPYCDGGESRDQNTFSINQETGLFKCFRANSCGVSGNLQKLAKDFNAVYVSGDRVKQSTKKYSKPTKEILSPKELIYKYFINRGIGKKIVDFAEIGMTKNGWISYNYKDDKNELTFRKFRSIKDKKIMRESNTKPVFYMMDKVKGESLIITEGEEDCLSIWQAGFKNAVSLPSGASDMTALTNCWDWVQKFSEIIIWTDSDKAGIKARNEIMHRLGEYKCKYIFSDKFKDANDCLKYGGEEGVKAMISTAKFKDIAEIITPDEINVFDDSDSFDSIESGFDYINRNTEGGYRGGDVIMWTGYTSCGKSTILSQEITTFLAQNESICIYSSESTNKKLLKTLYYQASGITNLIERYSERYDENYYFLDEFNVMAINDWIADRFYIVKDSFAGDYESLFAIFKNVSIRYGVKTFVIDNMATILQYNQNSLNDTQTGFIKKCTEFAKSFGVKLHIVAHQKNPTGDSDTLKPKKYGVLGSSNIPNLVDVMIGVAKLDIERDGCNGQIELLKERETGRTGGVQTLYFNKADKKFSEDTLFNRNDLGWENIRDKINNIEEYF